MTTRRARLGAGGVALVAALALAGPAQAAGTGGVEVSPLESAGGGRLATAFHIQLIGAQAHRERFLVRNLGAAPRTVRLYAAGATPDRGSFSIGAPGSSDLVSLPAQTLHLAAHQRLELTLTARARHQMAGTEYAAVVVEVPGAAVTTRAATLVYLQDAPGVRRGAGGLGWLLGTAGPALLLALGLVGWRLRQRRHFL